MPADERATLTHGMNCPGLTGVHPRIDHPDCTCGLRWRIQLRTEQEMHAAWRKRAEEAEQALKEADRLAREDAARIAKKLLRHSLASNGDHVYSEDVEAAIRVSITTDEGETK